MADYKKERTPGVPIINVPQTALTTFVRFLTQDEDLNYGGSHVLTYNDTITLNGKEVTFKNSNAGYKQYNLYDVIAGAVSVGFTYEEIDSALEHTYTVYKKRYNENIGRAEDNGASKQSAYEAAMFIDAYDAVKNKSTEDSVSQYLNQRTQPKLFEKINTDLPGAQLITTFKKTEGGDYYGSDYVYTIRYTNPLNGKEYEYPVDVDSFINDRGEVVEAKYNSWLESQPLNSFITQNNNVANNTVVQDKLSEVVLNALKGNVGSNANAYNTLSQADKDRVIAQLPDTTNLKAWTQTEDANIFNKIYNGLLETNPDLIDRTTLRNDSKTGLQDVADIISDEQLKITNRNINNQRQQLLQQIRNDPELYQAITSQLRTDNAAGTIAGQRAANAQQLAAKSDEMYDSAASDLYKSLFTGDSTVADTTRADHIDSQKAALDVDITNKLTQAAIDAKDSVSVADDLSSWKDTLLAALGVDEKQYLDAIAEEHAAADVEKDQLSSTLQTQLKKQLAENDAALQAISNQFGIAKDYLKSALNGEADVTGPVKTVIDKITNPQQFIASFTTEEIPDYQKAEQFTNHQYDDFLNNGTIQSLLSDDMIDSLTKQRTINDLLKDYGLADTLTEEGLRALYSGFAEEANKRSDQVFNAAQRAYIAAVTAGDTKTSEQLTKLAASAGTGKGNLYAASALANQFKQQFGLNNTGRQLATDFQNQQSKNITALSGALNEASKALTGYLNNSADNTRLGLINIKDIFNQSAGTNRDSYGKIGNAIMGTTQSLRSGNVTSNIQNYDRLSKLITEYNDANATAASNNVANAVTRDSLTTDATALQQQALTTNPGIAALKNRADTNKNSKK